jgi:4-amino-4-deoxy-L-arabinose transferase-like glycosyltransferase
VQDKTVFSGGASGRLFGGIKSYIWLFAGVFVCYLIASPFVSLPANLDASAPYDGDAGVMLVMALLLILLLGAGLFLLSRRRMTAGRLAFLLIAAGIVLRFGYMLYTPFYIRGHDVGSYTGYGHLAYIYRLFSLEGLPASNGGQFYHPPLAHAAGAAVARLYAAVAGSGDLDTVFESARIVPCFASCALLLLCLRLFNELGFSKRAATVALAVIAFHPTFILLSASINNDMVMILFFMAAFLCSVRWYNDPSYKNILLTALAIGCAMSAKFSGALIAVFTAMVFLVILARRFRAGKASGLAGQFAAFAAVCFPLGLWYQVRNLLLFGQPLGFVAEIGKDSALYVGNLPFSARILNFSLPDVLKNVYCDPWTDFRLWEYAVKSALFGEFTFSPKHDVLAAVLIVSSLVLILLSLAAMVWFLFFDRKKNRFAVLGFAAVWALLMLSFVYFNIKYPFGCTMDFRYIVPTVITGAAFLGLLSDRLAGGQAGSWFKKALSGCLVAVLAVFCLSAAIFYVM